MTRAREMRTVFKEFVPGEIQVGDIVRYVDATLTTIPMENSIWCITHIAPNAPHIMKGTPVFADERLMDVPARTLWGPALRKVGGE